MSIVSDLNKSNNSNLNHAFMMESENSQNLFTNSIEFKENEKIVLDDNNSPSKNLRKF